jgi:tRNA pseudouridine38-40 synthase
MRHDAASRIYNYIAPLRLFLSKEEQGRVLNELEREELVGRLNKLSELYLGTHNFHNFSKGYKQTDPRCDRYIMAMRAELVEEEVVAKYLEERFASEEERQAHGMTFIRFTLVGQSFIYHQIRKMVGLLVKICY